ncbi:VWA domain-containing protein [Myxococcus llanfairpwllgwyngyllgogerychwyrndrobwllllantysiliogogogochensis]|uniref:VWA domain-containing protein n=1 Tax=Myxococcus llanfairpwllgwyngyllgogerychwyrndrobwllllantysiliogogogochensis TaxID=2590453 RepID=A0A540X1X7_9BACT|nr:VWA domain-containing protein [Myxococcus llanfairpwllgwyngyllgogerychwyrndrobwllllantysiliogogogochensis]TQF15258.1 VWA domain-containing protein [Myxococcus llanfairpwllgwyngyllgogerychwyrndrobwllllantysiliogogogochensis]
MSVDPKELAEKDRDALLRWRLALGPTAEKTGVCPSLRALSTQAGSVGVGGGDLEALDDALSFVYGDKRASSSGSRPYIPEWLGALRTFFRDDVIALVQKDAIEKKGLTQLLFEPETLPFLDKNVELVTTLVSARGLIPDEAKAIARQIVREVVEELRKKLESSIRTAVFGALRRDRTSPLPIARNIDWKRTIRQNLKGWDAEHKRLVPERFYFWPNQRKHHEWDVTLVVDQSGSMAQSVVYSSVMAAIFASLDVLRTRLILFDTEVVDMTPLLTDPVEVLFTAQLGGGTDINRAVAYAQANHVQRPEKTLFLLITDLYEGGDAEELVARLRQLVDSRAKVLCLLSLSDGGKPTYDHAMAERLTALGIPCFGCTPKRLVDVVERVMRNQDLTPLLAAHKETHHG